LKNFQILQSLWFPCLSKLIFYEKAVTDAKGKVKIEVIYEQDTFWLSQKKMAELFDAEKAIRNPVYV